MKIDCDAYDRERNVSDLYWIFNEGLKLYDFSTFNCTIRIVATQKYFRFTVRDRENFFTEKSITLMRKIGIRISKDR